MRLAFPTATVAAEFAVAWEIRVRRVSLVPLRALAYKTNRLLRKKGFPVYFGKPFLFTVFSPTAAAAAEFSNPFSAFPVSVLP